MVLSYFPSALGVDDFISRMEVALCGYGFTGENSIGKGLVFVPPRLTRACACVCDACVRACVCEGRRACMRAYACV